MHPNLPFQPPLSRTPTIRSPKIISHQVPLPHPTAQISLHINPTLLRYFTPYASYSDTNSQQKVRERKTEKRERERESGVHTIYTYIPLYIRILIVFDADGQPRQTHLATFLRIGPKSTHPVLSLSLSSVSLSTIWVQVRV